MAFDTPAQLRAICDSAHAEYMAQLQKLWLAAGHPDVDGEGRPRARRLGAEERAAVMQERLGPIARRLQKDAWHHDCYSPRSSQALFVAVVAALEGAGATDVICGERDVQIEFEKTQGRTHFDAVLRACGKKVVGTLEAKFTEEGFGHCSYPARELCDGSWSAREGVHLGCPMAQPRANRATAERYWSVAAAVFLLEAGQPPTPQTCPLWSGYQIVHNLAETRSLDQGAIWTLVYDERNPYFGDPQCGWVSRLKSLAGSVRTLSWQDLFSAAMQRGCLVDHLKRLHGF